jgi:hypothetical protein
MNYREGHADKHLRDIGAMVPVTGTELDRSLLNDWIQRRGLGSEWQQVAG